ncbi:hypothetical protein L1887_01359 [Cichorium endivia]|nr:hypothetical protein L1887_01359 [Cichorium endivia]
MDSDLQSDYQQFVQQVASCPNSTTEYLSQLWDLVYQSYKQNLYSKPMPWIGVYIALASLLCILAMMADLLHGFRTRRLWFPCKYFTLNAASLTVIAVAVKLPMDLTTLMPGYVDQAAKLGSAGFMCAMMANLLPSIATMDTKELVSNIIALGVMVITLVVNVCIQMNTGVLSYHVDENSSFQGFNQTKISLRAFKAKQDVTAYSYVYFLLMLLITYVGSSLVILKSKRILELKYQAAHEATLKDEELKQPCRLLNVEKLKQHVSNYWIMAGTGSPQFMTVCSVTTSASGVICIFVALVDISIMPSSIQFIRDYNSDYKWSMSVILIIQFVGVIVGTIAPLSRCFAALSFKLSVRWIWNQFKALDVENCWPQNLLDWKHNSISSPSSSRRFKIVIQNLKNVILIICLIVHTFTELAFKMLLVIPIFFVFYLFRCWNWLKARFNSSSIVLVQSPEQLNLVYYVLRLQDDMEFTESTLKGMLKSVNHLIRKAEKQPPNNLIMLLAKSGGFGGVEKFDSHHVPPLLSEEYLNCWSLPLVTLTIISTFLPNIQKNIVDFLVNGVNEGLAYVTLVEESLNATDDHVGIQKAAKTLWVEVQVYHNWLGYKLKKTDSHVYTVGQILQWLRDTAKSMVIEGEDRNIGVLNDNSKYRSVSANSMYRITETILLSYHADIDQVSHKELFEQLSSMIADILAACLTNIPQVIAMKCHTSAIEKREASVHAAAQLLGEITHVINSLQQRELPSLDPDELAFIDKWRAYLRESFP